MDAAKRSYELKSSQLGMSPSTASNRLIKDILFKFVVDAGYKCHQCGKPMKRDDFSVEHIIPWLHSDDPVRAFFDLSNIAFSHLSCNVGSARQVNKKWDDPKDGKRYRDRFHRVYDPVKRRKQYERTGK